MVYRSPSTDRVVDRRRNRDPDGAGTETEDRSTRCAAHSELMLKDAHATPFLAVRKVRNYATADLIRHSS